MGIIAGKASCMAIDIFMCYLLNLNLGCGLTLIGIFQVSVGMKNLHSVDDVEKGWRAPK